MKTRHGGEFEGDGIVPLRGSAECNEAPRGGAWLPPWKCPVPAEDYGKEKTRRDTRVVFFDSECFNKGRVQPIDAGILTHWREEMRRTQLNLFLGLAVVVALVLGPACATKKYVQTETAAVDQKIQGVQTAVEESQKRIKEHDERLTTLGDLITQQQNDLKGVDGKIEDVKKSIQGTLVDKAVLANDQAKFKFDSAELGPEAKAAVDQFVQKLVADNRGVYLEIRGYTDNVGPDDYNLNLSKRRATAVMEFFYKQYHIPLYRMQVIGMGNADPVADNKTKEGRSQNRRVEILVYE